MIWEAVTPAGAAGVGGWGTEGIWATPDHSSHDIWTPVSALALYNWYCDALLNSPARELNWILTFVMGKNQLGVVEVPAKLLSAVGLIVIRIALGIEESWIDGELNKLPPPFTVWPTDK